MFKYKINLVTMSDINEFIRITSKEEGVIRLINDEGFCVNGKSLLGAIAAIEWDELYCTSVVDIYYKIEKFCV